jgi:ribosome biogenesis protein ERB1
MARAGPKKRKEPEQDEEHKSAFAEVVRLEMLSDEENREGDEAEEEESDEEVDEFPEIDAESDEEDEGEEDEGSSPSGSDSDSSSDMHIFPKSKNIISDITGHPKRVYPEIEPEYDSDSSIEDVRVSFPMTLG